MESQGSVLLCRGQRAGSRGPGLSAPLQGAGCQGSWGSKADSNSEKPGGAVFVIRGT